MATEAQLTAAENSYLDSCDYAEVGSVARARSFVTACRKLLVLLPSTMTKGANSVSTRTDLLISQIEEAQNWLSRFSPTDASPGPVVTETTFRSFRG
jgi:hypothetical protein